LATWYLGAKWQDAFTFALLAPKQANAASGLVRGEAGLSGTQVAAGGVVALRWPPGLFLDHGLFSFHNL
jgi:hypothetical protein